MVFGIHLDYFPAYCFVKKYVEFWRHTHTFAPYVNTSPKHCAEDACVLQRERVSWGGGLWVGSELDLHDPLVGEWRTLEDVYFSCSQGTEEGAWGLVEGHTVPVTELDQEPRLLASRRWLWVLHWDLGLALELPVEIQATRRVWWVSHFAFEKANSKQVSNELSCPCHQGGKANTFLVACQLTVLRTQHGDQTGPSNTVKHGRDMAVEQRGWRLGAQWSVKPTHACAAGEGKSLGQPPF